MLISLLNHGMARARKSRLSDTFYNLKPGDKVRILDAPFEMKTITVSCSCSHHSSIIFPEDSEVLDFWIEEYRREGCEPIIADRVIPLGAGKKMSRTCGRSSDEENSYSGRYQ